MVEQEKAAALLRSLDEVLSKHSLQDNISARKKAIGLSRALTLALDEPANTAIELIFSVSSRFLDGQPRELILYRMLRR